MYLSLLNRSSSKTKSFYDLDAKVFTKGIPFKEFLDLLGRGIPAQATFYTSYMITNCFMGWTLGKLNPKRRRKKKKTPKITERIFLSSFFLGTLLRITDLVVAALKKYILGKDDGRELVRQRKRKSPLLLLLSSSCSSCFLKVLFSTFSRLTTSHRMPLLSL